MDWSAFLILLLTALLTAPAVWWGILKGFHDNGELPSLETPRREQPGLNAESPQALYWSFTTVLISICVLLLVMGISVQTMSIRHPVTWTLAAALVLVWVMALWSGMLTPPRKQSIPPGNSHPELTLYHETDEPSLTEPEQKEEA